MRWGVLYIEASKDKKLIWISLPIELSDFIPILTKLDFEFHHCDERTLTLLKKVVPRAVVPTAKNFVVGLGAIVFNEGQLLVVKDRFSKGYKLPGGHIDKNESFKDALKREVYEETGVEIAFESILNIGHFRNGQFGAASLYIVCTASVLTAHIQINDPDEIIEARWIDPEAFLQSADANNYNKSVVKAALSNKELKLTPQHIKLKVPDGEVFY